MGSTLYVFQNPIDWSGLRALLPSAMFYGFSRQYIAMSLYRMLSEFIPMYRFNMFRYALSDPSQDG